VLFTWPSWGSVLAYGYDRESSTYSRNALEDVLKALAKDPAVGEISVLAYSMGNVVTFEALRQMAIRDGRVTPKIRNVMLAAPDVDVDLAKEAVSNMHPERHAPSVLGRPSFSNIEPCVARVCQARGHRSGSGTLPNRSMPIENYGSQPYQLNSGDILNHGKFAESPEVVQIILPQLAGGQVLTDSRVGVGNVIIGPITGLASSVGRAAGVVVAAPVPIVDPRTRGSLVRLVQELGHPP
jgi:esterase/lipase superfamily enzyme